MSYAHTRGGTKFAKLRREFKAQCAATNQRCWICREPINYNLDWRHRDSFQPDHYYPVSTHPHLQYEPTNLRPSHFRCNASRGNTIPANAGWSKADW